MKEAAGEANMTIITIVLIVIVLAVGTIIVQNVMKTTSKSSCCTNSGYTWKNGKCYSGCTADADTGEVVCGNNATLVTNYSCD